MMNVVTDSTEVIVVRSRPLATFEPDGFHLPGIRGYTGQWSSTIPCGNRVSSTNLEELLLLGPVYIMPIASAMGMFAAAIPQ